MTSDQRSKGFAFFAYVRLKWPRLGTMCPGIHCRLPGCDLVRVYRQEWRRGK
jgi:hypothetical protein